MFDVRCSMLGNTMNAAEVERKAGPFWNLRFDFRKSLFRCSYFVLFVLEFGICFLEFGIHYGCAEKIKLLTLLSIIGESSRSTLPSPFKSVLR